MPLPASFDINSFDNVDLWHVTQALAADVPGLHVARIFDPKYDSNKSISYMQAFLHTPEIDGQRVEFDDADFRGTAEEMAVLKEQARQTMGNPQVFETVLSDTEPMKTPNHELQREVARAFLPYIGYVTLARVVRKESDGDLIRQGIIAQAKRHTDRPAAPTLVAHAKINVYLASLTGEELTPYEDIVDRAASWEPLDSIPRGLKWLV